MTATNLVFLSALLFNVGVGVWILAKRSRAAPNIWFAAITAVFTVWGISELLVIGATTAQTALRLEAFAYMAGAFLPLCCLQFVSACGRDLFRRTLPLHRAATGVAVAFFCISLVMIFTTDLILTGFIMKGAKLHAVVGPGFPIFAFLAVLGVLYPFIWITLAGLQADDSFVRRQAVVLGLSPLTSVFLFLLLEVLPLATSGSRTLPAFPATVAFCGIVGLASSRLSLLSVTPEGAAREVLETQPDAVFLVNRQGHVEYRNTALASLLGRDPLGPAAPLHVRDVLEILSPGYESVLSLPLQELPPALDVKGEAKTAGGTRIPVVVTFRKLQGGPRGPQGAIFVLRDERPLRKIEAEMIHLEKIHSLGIMVSGVAHELNNPLTTIIGYAELGRDPVPPDQATSYFETIHRQAVRAHSVIKSLVAFAGTSPGYASPVSLNQTVKEVLSLRSTDLERQQVAINLALAQDLPLTQADPHKVRQIVLNLLNNAVQAVERAMGPGTVTVTTGYQEGELSLALSDTGPGIPEEIRPRIFDPFFTTQVPGKGTGLGLSITQVLVTDLGGRIEVDSRSGEGATFTVHLPRVVPGGERPAPATPQRKEPAPGPGPTVLIVDDDEALVAMMREALRVRGCTVDVASNGELGLAAIREGEYDIILCDVRMPRLDGPTLITRLAEEVPAVLKRLILCTGDTASPETRDLIRTSGLRTLEKPFRIADLLDVISLVLKDASPSLPF